MKRLQLTVAFALVLSGCGADTPDSSVPAKPAAAMAPHVTEPESFRTIIPEQSVFPLRLVASGVLTTGQVASWPTDDVLMGTFTADNRVVVENLHRRGCTITLQVVQRDQSGLFYSTEAPVVVTCLNSNGARSSIRLRGTLTDSAGKTGSKSNAVGDSAFFLVHTGGVI